MRLHFYARTAVNLGSQRNLGTTSGWQVVGQREDGVEDGKRGHVEDGVSFIFNVFWRVVVNKLREYFLQFMRSFPIWVLLSGLRGSKAAA